MEYFLREYATRSMLPHLNAIGGSLLRLSGASGSPNETEIIRQNSGDYYYIATQQLLNNSNESGDDGGTDYLQEAMYNATGNQVLKLASLASVAMGSAPSPTQHGTTVSEVSNQPLSSSATLDTVSPLNNTLYESYASYLNFSCDGESLSTTALNASAAAGAEDDDAAFSSVYFKTAVYLLYIPIFVFALLGNGTVCYIVQSTPRMRTVTNYFIANLAVGDILMSLFCVPFSFVSIFILYYWPFGIALCYLVNYSQAVSVLVSAYTLVAISIDRYIAIMWPLRPRITKRYAKFIIAGVWGIALVTAFPIPIVSTLVQPDIWHVRCERYICREVWPSNEQYYYYTLALFTLQFVVPLAVLIFTYTRIALAVWGKRPPGEAENSRDQRMARSKRKMIKMMVMVVIVFTICWLPFNILVLLLNDEEFRMWKPLPYFWFAFHWLAMSHSCYNPIIYCYMNARFRGGFLQIIYRVPGLRRCCCMRRYLRNRGERNYEATGEMTFKFIAENGANSQQQHVANGINDDVDDDGDIGERPFVGVRGGGGRGRGHVRAHGGSGGIHDIDGLFRKPKIRIRNGRCIPSTTGKHLHHVYQHQTKDASELYASESIFMCGDHSAAVVPTKSATAKVAADATATSAGTP